jgi:membrane protein YdbS with pleckstrin-like domain
MRGRCTIGACGCHLQNLELRRGEPLCGSGSECVLCNPFLIIHMSDTSKVTAADGIVLKQNPSWFHAQGSFFFAFLFFVIGAALFFYPITGYQPISGMLALLVLFFAAVILIAEILRHYSTEYTLTEAGVVKAQGLFSKDVMTIPYGKIQDIKLKKSFVERILGIGNIYIDTAGENGIEMVIRGISNPDKSYNMILGMMKK